MSNFLQRLGQRAKDTVIGAYHQVYTGDGGKNFRSYNEEEKRRRLMQQEAAKRAAAARPKTSPQAPQQPKQQKPNTKPTQTINGQQVGADGHTEAGRKRLALAKATEDRKKQKAAVAASKPNPVKNAAKVVWEGIKEAPAYVGEGLAIGTKDVQDANRARIASMGSDAEIIKTFSRKLKDPNLDPATRQRMQAFLDKKIKESASASADAIKESQRQLEATDPVRAGAAVASMGVDVVTAPIGIGGGQAIKIAGATAAKKATEAGATKQAAKIIARKAAAKELAKQTVKSGSLAAPSGALAPVIEKGNDASAGDILKGAGIAFGVGGILPASGYVGGKVAKKARAKNAVAEAEKVVDEVGKPVATKEAAASDPIEQASQALARGDDEALQEAIRQTERAAVPTPKQTVAPTVPRPGDIVKPTAANDVAKGGVTGSTVSRTYPDRLPGESMHDYQRRIIESQSNPVDMPQDHSQYFNLGKAHDVVPTNLLDTTKGAAENALSGENAKKLLQAARDRVIGKRDPIKVVPRPDGRYSVIDGNGTLAGVADYGWTDLPVEIVNPEHWKAANALVARAEQIDSGFQNAMQDIASRVGLDYYPGTIKKVERVLEKAISDYHGDVSKVRDSVRGTIEMSEPKDIERVLQEIGQVGEVTRIKNGYTGEVTDMATGQTMHEPVRMGEYRDIKINVRTPEGHDVEVILATPEMLSAKDDFGGHELYQQVRIKSEGWQEAKRKMQALYNSVHEAEVARMGYDPAPNMVEASSADMDLPSASAFTGGNGTPVDTTVPETSVPSSTTLTTVPSTSKNSSVITDTPYDGSIPPVADTFDGLHPEEQKFVKEYAAHLKSLDEGLEGGQMVPGSDGGYIRTSEHTPFYRQVYAETGRPPTDKDWLNHSYALVSSGKSEFQDYFDQLHTDLANPELQSLYNSIDTTPRLQQNVTPDMVALDTSGLPLQEVDRFQNIQLNPGTSAKPTPLGFTQSARKSSEVSPEVAAKLRGTGDNLTNAELVANSEEFINRDIKEATNAVLDSLNKKPGSLTAQEVSDGIALAKKLDMVAEPISQENTAKIYDKLAEHLRAAGQEVQAAALLSRQTSTGLYYRARKLLKGANVEITPELDQALRAKLKAVEATDSAAEQLDVLGNKLDATDYADPNFKQVLDEYAAQKEIVNQRYRDIFDFQQVVATNLPKKRGSKLIDIWKGGLLTAPTTHFGGMLSNAVESTYTSAIRDPLAVALDAIFSSAGKAAKGIGLFRDSTHIGTRTKGLALRGGGSGFKIGVKKGKEYFKTGFDSRDVAGKFNATDANAGGKYPGIVYRALGSQDQPFWYMNYYKTLREQANIAMKNMGLEGEARDNFLKAYMLKPPKGADNIAQEAARRSVFGNDTLLNNYVGAMRRVPGGETLMNFAIPFSRVPSAVAMRILERSPAGAVMEVARQIKARRYDQRALVEALSDSTVGTAGSLMLGAALVNAGAITLGYPKDEKTRNQWAAEGKQPYSIRFGNTWLSLNYVQPFGSLLAAGAQYEQARKDGKSSTEAMSSAAGAAGQSVVGQSFLKGVSGMLNAIQQPDQLAASFVNNTAGSVVPNIVKRAATATDPKQRQVNSPLDGVIAGIPGLRQSLDAKTDTFGNDLSRKTGALHTFLNPLNPSDMRSTPVTDEIDRLAGIKDENGRSLAVLPSKVDRKMSFDGLQVELTPEQRTTLQKSIGQNVQSMWGKMIASPEYQSLSDSDKQSALEKLMSDVSAVEKRKFAEANGYGQFSAGYAKDKKALTDRQDALTQSYNNFDVGNYAINGGGTVSTKIAKTTSQGNRAILTQVNAMSPEKRKQYLTDPKSEYSYEVAKYENGVKSGELKGVDQYNALQSLGKLKVQSGYSREAIELYTLSKTKLRDYMEKGGAVPDALLQEVFTMDQQLADEGFISKPKYNWNIGSAAGGSGSGGGGRRRSGGGGSSSSDAVTPPLPKFGSFSLVEPPKSMSPSMNSVLKDLQAAFSGIAVLQGVQLAPGQDSSKIQFSTV